MSGRLDEQVHGWVAEWMDWWVNGLVGGGEWMDR